MPRVAAVAATEGLAPARWLLASLALAACEALPDRGLEVTEVDASFEGLVRDAGPGSGEEDGPDEPAEPLVACQNVEGFTRSVTPYLVKRCILCHDGTKAKATKAFDLTTVRDQGEPAQAAACAQALRAAPDSSDESPLFASVNPGDADAVHDFKFASAMLYMTYRADVLSWLETE